MTRSLGQRSRLVRMVGSITAASAFMLVYLCSPYSTDMASAAYRSDESEAGTQGVLTSGNYNVSANGETYVSGRRASATAGMVVPEAGTVQAIAYEYVIGRGWNDEQFACLVTLWNHESNWRVNAGNPVSGAYGIPQALPGNKMASAGEDWSTNPATQIRWGLGYIAGRYGTPCNAWADWQDKGWY
ncbi:MAG TPA: lytic transglycosylase domain-containing protein [Microbacteriaceae bacterium]|nr:lytic transglycosylase domain-containing protein [Microbacteriaceae bacterium]